jgi:hypothetical protein
LLSPLTRPTENRSITDAEDFLQLPNLKALIVPKNLRANKIAEARCRPLVFNGSHYFSWLLYMDLKSVGFAGLDEAG